MWTTGSGRAGVDLMAEKLIFLQRCPHEIVDHEKKER
jgi:hypothetical protein